MRDDVGCRSNTHPKKSDRQGVIGGEHGEQERHPKTNLEGANVLDEVLVVRFEECHQLIEHWRRNHGPQPERGEGQACHGPNGFGEAVPPGVRGGYAEPSSCLKETFTLVR